jgi:hypothetical protein
LPCIILLPLSFVLQELLGHSSHRQELLLSVWAAFLKISEAALQVAFKSEYLVLAGASSAAMNELLFTKEALSEVSVYGEWLWMFPSPGANV